MGSWILACAVGAGLCGATPAWAGKLTCLTGTDPSVASDLSQITAVRALIDAGCVCASFDGTSGKTQGKYVACAAALINTQAGVAQLRSQCKATVKKYYSTSTCGVPVTKAGVPCIKKTAAGRVTCAIKPSAQCTDAPGKYTQAACTGFSNCIDAADTNHDGIVGASDSGACAAAGCCLASSGRCIDTGNAPTLTQAACQGSIGGTWAPGHHCGEFACVDGAPMVSTRTPTRTVTPTTTLTQTFTRTPTITVTPTTMLTQTFTRTPTTTVTPTPVPRFVDNGNGTITDNQTGLMWEKKDDAGGIHDKDNYYSWCLDANSDVTCDNAGYPPDGGAFTVFLATLNTPPCFAGHCDWRLPTSAGCCGYPTGQAAELESILAAQYPNCTSSPCVPAAFNTNCTRGCSATGCSCTVSNLYWSGSTVSANPNYAWNVIILNGNVHDGSKTDNYYVRAVRRGS